MRVREPEALERAEVVRVAELLAQPLELVPVPLLPLGAEVLRQVRAQVGGDGVVVEQRVVDVEEEDGRVRHGGLPSARRSAASMLASANRDSSSRAHAST